MPAKKIASKKPSKATTSKQKVAAKKVSKKKMAAKKVAKKAVAEHSTSKKTSAKRKTSTKKSASRKASKKAVSKPVSNKKTISKPTPGKSSKRKAIAQKAVGEKPPPKRSRSRGDVLTGPIHGIEPYKTRRGEEYMSEGQLEHFRRILTAWKRELMFEVDRTVHHMQDEAANFPDPNDRATQESEFGLELRTRDRERKLLRKIEAALTRIDEGSYGFCDETGEEIGLKRLEARPVATLCLEAQERREVAERQFRDRDDRYR